MKEVACVCISLLMLLREVSSNTSGTATTNSNQEFSDFRGDLGVLHPMVFNKIDQATGQAYSIGTIPQFIIRLATDGGFAVTWGK